MNIKVGDVLVSKYNYGDEVQLFKFFIVDKLTDSSVTLTELESKTTYDDGLSGAHYYDDPRHVSLVEPITRVGKSIRRKHTKDTKYIKTDDYWYAYKVWHGEPLEIYNLH